MPAGSHHGATRAQRVGEMMQRELAQLLIDGIKDPRIGFVTVTEVRVTADLRNARAFVSVYGEEPERRATLEGLRDASGYLRRELSHRLRLRYMPSLEFEHDDTLDRAQRLESLIATIAEGGTEPPAPLPLAPVPIETTRSDLEASRRTLEEQRRRHEPPPRTRRGRSSRRRVRGRS